VKSTDRDYQDDALALELEKGWLRLDDGKDILE